MRRPEELAPAILTVLALPGLFLLSFSAVQWFKGRGVTVTHDECLWTPGGFDYATRLKIQNLDQSFKAIQVQLQFQVRHIVREEFHKPRTVTEKTTMWSTFVLEPGSYAERDVILVVPETNKLGCRVKTSISEQRRLPESMSLGMVRSIDHRFERRVPACKFGWFIEKDRVPAPAEAEPIAPRQEEVVPESAVL